VTAVETTADETGGGRKTLNLALQGGGAHGAFAWGVLDRLLDDERIDFEGITATSAGAMNAVVVASGLAVGGRPAAKETLRRFWSLISQSTYLSPLQTHWLDRLLGQPGRLTPLHVAFDLVTRLVSPYQFNPLNINPLKALLEDCVDFEALHRACPVRLFISATNVRSGKIKIFEDGEVTAESVMASACLPHLFQAVEIAGEAYWDGGYMGNPAIYPLIYNCQSRDVAIIHINPLTRQEIPKDATEIFNRLNEISFNSSLMREMRTIAFVTDLIDRGQLSGRPMKRMLIHAIEAEAFMRELGVHSKTTPDWDFLTMLHDVGRRAADAWLAANFAQIGESSTVDLKQVYL